MKNKAKDFLPQVRKLEPLLDHNLNITGDILTDRVDKTIANQLSNLGISEILLDINTIDWEKLVSRAVDRLPPFEATEKEKGFRDALIAESFFQLIDKSPKTPSACRLVFVTEDEILAKFLKESTAKNKNVRILNNLNELESLINTLVSKVTEEFISEIRDEIDNFFMNTKKETGLYYSEGIEAQIKDKYYEELDAVPTEGLTRENGTWWISKPVFINKSKSRIEWMTPIKVEAKLSKYVSDTPLTGVISENLYSNNLYGTAAYPSRSNVFVGLSGSIYPQQPIQAGLGSFLSENPKKIMDAGEGYSKFEVKWSINITPTKKLTKPTIDDIKFISSKWDD